MHIRLLVLRWVKVHNTVDSINVNPARRDVSADEHLESLRLERLERLIALSLRAIAVDRPHIEAGHLEMFHEAIDTALCPAKDHRGLVHSHDAGREGDPFAGIGAPEVMGRRLADLIFFAVDFVTLGIVLIPADQLLDVAIERRRKEQRLTARADLVKKFSDNWHEAHVCHPVCLVDDDNFNLVQPESAAIDEIREPTGTRDGDVDTSTQRVKLRTKSHAAVKTCHPTVPQSAEVGELLADLRGELAGRGKNQCLWTTRRGVTYARDDGNSEGKRLARACWRPSTDVVASQCIGKRGGLDWKCVIDSSGMEAANEILGNTEFSKSNRQEKLQVRGASSTDEGDDSPTVASVRTGVPGLPRREQRRAAACDRTRRGPSVTCTDVHVVIFTTWFPPTLAATSVPEHAPGDRDDDHTGSWTLDTGSPTSARSPTAIRVRAGLSSASAKKSATT